MTQGIPPRRRPFVFAAALLGAALLGAVAAAGEAELVAPEPATFHAFDLPNDDGSEIAVEWGRSPSEGAGIVYIVEIASEEDGEPGAFKVAAQVPFVPNPEGEKPRREGETEEEWKERLKKLDERPRVLKADFPQHFGLAAKRGDLYYTGVTPAALYRPEPREIRPAAKDDLLDKERENTERRFEADRLKDERRKTNARRYYIRLAISDGQRKVYVEENGEPKVVAARARPNYFAWNKSINFVFSILFCGIVLAFIRIARRNPNLFIRRIAGLEAIEEAIGRSTEMGRPVLFVHGLGSMGNLATIAAVNILGRVCRQAAEYDTRVRVANNDFIVMAVSQEVAKQACTEAGRPDAYNADDVMLVAYEQFSYVAAVAGLMMRERPAAIFHMGYFYAEALFLAETGAASGAIQIAGTDAYTQLPFFITTCDYTLMGEELYAASAYLSRQPKLLGSLRGQDVGKAFLMLVLLLGSLLALFGLEWMTDVLNAFAG